MARATNDVVVPAQTLRTLAREASENAERLRSDGHRATAERLETQVGRAFSALDGKDGEFVAFSGSDLSSLTAEAQDRSHRAAARVYLEKYGIWG